MTTLELPLPQNPNAGLRRAHWATRRKAQREWKKSAGAAIGWRFPSGPFERARVRCRFFVWNLCDRDNLATRQKWILDFLTADANVPGRPDVKVLGWLVDDSPRHLILEEPEQEIDRKNPRVEVTIEEIEE